MSTTTAKRYPQGIMSTVCIPWDDNYKFAEAVFRRGVRHSLKATPHLYVFGTAGEGYAVTDTQFDQIVKAFASEMQAGKAEAMVGVINLSLGTMLERIRRCRDMGVTHFQISLPNWAALQDSELFLYFEKVCNTFLDCKFVHYNLPRTKRLVTGKEYGKLANAHPNLVGTKNCGDSLSLLQGLIEHSPQLQHFLSEAGYVYGSMFGECSILASFIMNWPKLQALLDAGKRRDIATMTSINREINIVAQTLFEAVPDNRIDGSYDKLFEKMYDPEVTLRLQPPYIGTSDEEFRTFVKLLAERLPEWIPAQISH